jgi:SAM-dependent methyltransferase
MESEQRRAEDLESTADLRRSYDRVADEYARRYFEELDHKPFDRTLLERFAQTARHLGPVCDMGCGPGQIARFLRGQGAEALGVDLSPGTVQLARRLNPGIEFHTGNMLALDVADAVWGGIAAFYSIIHVPRREVVPALVELKRVLVSGGLLLLSFHVGEEDMHLDELWGEPVSMDFFFFTQEEMAAYVESAGLELLERHQRPPYEGVEYESTRGYLLARKPGP